ncbi:MAG: hypothetical protein KIS73_20335 [Enhydrobacter sp.]|nr:hypothetical protein [Enhydrobacter sp.]
MSRLNIIVIAAGAFASVAVLSPTPRAQSGDALAHAESVCLDAGIGPHSVPFEACVTRAAQAYDRGQPYRAAAEARTIGDASKACLANDVEPMTQEYRQCMVDESTTTTAYRYAAR